MFKLNEAMSRLLIVDDEPEIRNMLCRLLSESYSCESAASAEDALARLGEKEFDLVLSDIQMDGMSGLELLPLLRALAPDTQAILISGMDAMASPIEALRAGAYDYIMKPFDLLHVEASVKRALEHKTLLATKRHYENYLEELVEQRAGELKTALGSLAVAYRTTLKALTSALETRDQETHGHSERVVSFSLRLGRELNLNEDELRSLEFGALLHDIGKIGVPDAILRKPAKLTEEEWEKMREHPMHGERILSGINFLKGAAHVVAEHHEMWDGSGYPRGLRGEEIALNARIFAVADAFDAMTNDRVYRAALSFETAVTELDDFAGRQFDPQVVAAFRRVPRHEWDELRGCTTTTTTSGELQSAERLHPGASPEASVVNTFLASA